MTPFAARVWMAMLPLVVVALAACTPNGSSAAPAVQPQASSLPAVPSPATPVSGQITVFAAASLTDAFNDMTSGFQQANPSASLRFNFGASSTLATQLGQGAKADVFASADPAQMATARNGGAIVGPDQVFARNRLVLITPKDNPAHIASVKDLAKPGVKIVAAQPSVPIGQYTDQLLARASSDPAYGADFQTKVTANIVSREADVRAVVSKVQLGEADAAIVYSTDPTPQVRNQVQVLPIPDALQQLATYPIAVARGSNPAGGQAFVAYVLGPQGQATLAKWGFLPPDDSSPEPSSQP